MLPPRVQRVKTDMIYHIISETKRCRPLDSPAIGGSISDPLPVTKGPGRPKSKTEKDPTMHPKTLISLLVNESSEREPVQPTRRQTMKYMVARGDRAAAWALVNNNPNGLEGLKSTELKSVCLGLGLL